MVGVNNVMSIVKSSVLVIFYYPHRQSPTRSGYAVPSGISVGRVTQMPAVEPLIAVTRAAVSQYSQKNLFHIIRYRDSGTGRTWSHAVPPLIYPLRRLFAYPLSPPARDGRVFPARSSTVTVSVSLSPHGAGGKAPASSPLCRGKRGCRSIMRR